MMNSAVDFGVNSFDHADRRSMLRFSLTFRISSIRRDNKSPLKSLPRLEIARAKVSGVSSSFDDVLDRRSILVLLSIFAYGTGKSIVVEGLATLLRQ